MPVMVCWDVWVDVAINPDRTLLAIQTALGGPLERLNIEVDPANDKCGGMARIEWVGRLDLGCAKVTAQRIADAIVQANGGTPVDIDVGIQCESHQEHDLWYRFGRP